MRRPFTTRTALERGITRSALSWAAANGDIQHAGRGVYVLGRKPLTREERAAAVVIASGGVASGTFAGFLHGLDGVVLAPPHATVPTKSIRKEVRTAVLQSSAICVVRKYRCTTGLQTMLDLASILDDLEWEQSLESALRKRLVTIAELKSALGDRRVGNGRIRRVLGLRPDHAPPTESIMETKAVQLMRQDPALPVPDRQVEIHNVFGEFQGRVDLAFPAEGVFFELDGQQHMNQPVYDANRQTRIVAATGWLVGRFTWDEIVRNPVPTLRRISQLFDMARSVSRAS